MRATIVATGSYVPEKVVANADLTQFPASGLHLIGAKTGIKFRRHAQAGEMTSDLALRAAQACLAVAGVDAGSIDAIILATSSPDRIQPATATRVQTLLGATKAFAFDINSVCAGAVYGICLADSLIRSNTCKTVLLVASEVYSRFLNPSDFSTYPYFGDGAGAVLFGRNEADTSGVIESVLGADGSGANLIQVPAGGSALKIAEMTNPKDAFFQMDGKAVYGFATTKAPEIIREVLAKAGIDKDKVAFVIPHQANINIIKEIASKVGIEFSKFVTNLDRYGNTAAASVLVALDELFNSGTVKDGDLLVTCGFGGGLSWGANVISLSRR